MRYFPIFTDFGGARVLVVGGGEEAAAKVRLLLKTDARIEIVAATLDRELDGLVSNGGVSWAALEFEDALLDGATAVFSAAGDAIDPRVSRAARGRGLPVNVVDRPDLSTFIVPAIVDRDPLVVAIGTEGAGPVLAQGVRAEIERLLPSRIGELALAGRALRDLVGRVLPKGAARREFWQNFFFGRIRDAFLADDRDGFDGAVSRAVAGRPVSAPGRVSLVGTGPGDPEHLTLMAHRKLQEADVILHDGGIPMGILDYARRDAIRIAYAAGADVAGTLLAEARQGRHVVCLASGRGEFATVVRRLRVEGVWHEIVPGVGADAPARVIELAPHRRRRASS